MSESRQSANVRNRSKADTALMSAMGGNRTYADRIAGKLWPLAVRPLMSAFDPSPTLVGRGARQQIAVGFRHTCD